GIEWYRSRLTVSARGASAGRAGGYGHHSECPGGSGSWFRANCGATLVPPRQELLMSHENSQFSSSFEIHLTAQRLDDATRRERMNNPRFGTVFTEHQVAIRWSRDSGWAQGRI